MTKRSRLPIRTIDITRYQDTFLICAVATILIIRTQLWLTNYPQLGGHGLHIAHLLWGGLLMLIALGLLLSFLGRPVKQAASVIGGIGFGFFIDELGKFVTSNNNYFFKPAAGLIYLVFICLYLTTRALQQRRGFTSRENLANVFDLLLEAGRHDLDKHEKRRAYALLRRVDKDDPLVAPLRRLVHAAPAQPAKEAPRIKQFWLRVRARYYRVVERRWFTRTLIWVFTVWALLVVLRVLTLALGGTVSFINVCDAISSGVAALFVFAGVRQLLKKNRIEAYRMFEISLEVQIFITQVFIFVESQFGAAFGLAISILLLVTVRYMLRRERQSQYEREEQEAEAREAGAAPATA